MIPLSLVLYLYQSLKVMLTVHVKTGLNIYRFICACANKTINDIVTAYFRVTSKPEEDYGASLPAFRQGFLLYLN